MNLPCASLFSLRRKDAVCFLVQRCAGRCGTVVFMHDHLCIRDHFRGAAADRHDLRAAARFPGQIPVRGAIHRLVPILIPLELLQGAQLYRHLVYRHGGDQRSGLRDRIFSVARTRVGAEYRRNCFDYRRRDPAQFEITLASAAPRREYGLLCMDSVARRRYDRG